MHKTIGHHHHNVSRREDVVEQVVNANRCTFPVLDALASISVSEPRHQVVALALQLRSQERRIRLTIAENDDVKDSLVPYLTSVWGKLRALSDEYAGQRAAGEDPQRLDGFRGDSRSIPPDVGLSIRVDIFREIYQYTMQKNQRRVGKWRHPFSTLIRQLHKVRGGNLHGLEKELESAFFGLDHAYYLLSKQSLTEEDWRHIMIIMRVAADRAKLVTEDNWTCEILANQLKDPEAAVPFQPRRALEKLTSQHRHFHALVAFAHSPRLRFAFECDLSIATVPKSPDQSVQLPSSVAQWKSIIDNICMGSYRRGEDWPDQEAEDLASVFQTPAFSAHIHCECALIEYLENNTGVSRRGGNAGGSGIAEKKVV
ncbi:hypothetical protein L873DRAFT_48125 [Choiromyces venosus 120613-1]|uniref:Uncharacterized protein n=1 Tax=Choiromyces venosus 120613-1 TaxID=1336337 RepID=A0A3N4K0C0_9PEZI|nr:hypothetical protein L873DRAFT_48125 [Choiromyces venosus 120613-1]